MLFIGAGLALLPTEVHAQTPSSLSQANAGFWWNDDKLFFTGVYHSFVEASTCQNVEFDSEAWFNRVGTGPAFNQAKEDFFKGLGECLKREESDIPKDAVVTPSFAPKNSLPPNIPNNQAYYHQYKFTTSGIQAAELDYYCEFERTTTDSYILQACRTLKLEDKSWEFHLNGYDVSGDALFINTQFKDTHIVHVKDNVVQKVSRDFGLDSKVKNNFNDIKDYEGKSIRGTPGIYFRQSAARFALEQQKPRLEKEFYDNCLAKANAPGSTAKAVHCTKNNGAFETIWRTCAVITGDAKADLSAAHNCLKTYGGVTLDLDRANEIVPPEPTEGNTYSCKIDFIGYIICPLTTFMAGAADGMFGAMKQLLQISPLDQNQPGGRGTYAVWKAFRDIANVLFVVAILAIALSQVSGFGITNYGAKKALPKLILGAIILNLSFIVCAALLDISNIAGDGIYNILLDINQTLPKNGDFITADMSGQNVNSDGSGALLNWSFLIGLGLASAGELVAIVLMFTPILVTVIIALVTVILMLVTRHALIIILTVAAPIALACYMLPNTKQWFSKWQKTYVTMLFMYPAIALIFGLSTIAANVILQIGTANDSLTLRLFALAIQTAPLMVTPIVMKMGGQVLGSIGNFAKNNGMMKGMRGTGQLGQQLANNGLRIRALRGGAGPLGSLYRRKKVGDAAREMRQSNLSNARAQYVADYLQAKEGSGGEAVSFIERAKQKATGGRYTAKNKAHRLQNTLGAGGGDGADLALAYAKNASINLLNDEAKAHKLSMRGLSGSALHNELTNISQNSDAYDEAYKLAVIQTAMSTEGSEDEDAINLAIQASGSVGVHTRQYLLQSSRQSYLKHFVDNPETQQAILNGTVNSTNFAASVIAPTINDGQLSASDLQEVVQVGGLKTLQNAKAGGHLSAAGEANLRKVADELLANSQLMGKLDKKTAATDIQSLR